MDQEIRFCTSADGTKIAYAVYRRGTGTPLVIVESWTLGMEQAWQQTKWSATTEAFGRGRLLAEFDRRGIGSSQRDVADISAASQLQDLEAVVDHLQLERFAILGRYDGGTVAVEYAVAHPERVSHLILNVVAVHGDQTATGRLHDKLIDLIRSDWSLARRIWATAQPAYSTVEEQRVFSQMFRDSVAPEMAIRYLQYTTEVDIGRLLPRIQAPTLVAQPKSSQIVSRESARELASLIPNARFVVLGGDPLSRVLNEFIGDEIGAPFGSAIPTGTAIILFADIAGSTALTERLGDAAFREKARDLDASLRRAITSNGGTAIEGKLLGDGVLATFGAAREAIGCASAIHAAGSLAGLRLHVGIHAGDVIREANNVFGGAVNIAARVAGEAAAGETLVSGTVRDLARTSAGVSFEDRGERELKGVGEPVRVFAVRSGDASPLLRERAGG